jgi:Flp pilus assembly protein TadG
MRQSSRQKRGRDDRGAAAVEFALVLPVLLLVIFGIIDFGRLLYAKITLSEAAHAGARAAALVGESAAQDEVAKSVTGLDTSAGPVTATVSACANDPTADATVTVHYTFKLVTPLGILAGIGGSNGEIALSETSVMPCAD